MELKYKATLTSAGYYYINSNHYYDFSKKSSSEDYKGLPECHIFGLNFYLWNHKAYRFIRNLPEGIKIYR